jgi:hypothetical protein
MGGRLRDRPGIHLQNGAGSLDRPLDAAERQRYIAWGFNPSPTNRDVAPNLETSEVSKTLETSEVSIGARRGDRPVTLCSPTVSSLCKARFLGERGRVEGLGGVWRY